jgi:hypothetical protein
VSEVLWPAPKDAWPKSLHCLRTNHRPHKDDEHTFWREVEGLQMQLDALEQLTPHEMRQAGVVFANLQAAWRAATLDEKQELCQIILKQVVYDFGTGKIVSVIPKPEYEVLFGMAGYSG